VLLLAQVFSGMAGNVHARFACQRGARGALPAGAAWSLPVIVLGAAAPVLASTA